MNPSFSSCSLSPSPDKIRVLYVDHDNTHDADLLKDIFTQAFWEVTMVESDSTALELLSNGNSKFDLLMENYHSAYSNGFRLLHDATKMDTPVLMLADNDDPVIQLRGLMEGAVYCIHKPITFEKIRDIWQLVAREKMLKANEKAFFAAKGGASTKIKTHVAVQSYLPPLLVAMAANEARLLRGDAADLTDHKNVVGTFSGGIGDNGISFGGGVGVGGDIGGVGGFSGFGTLPNGGLGDLGGGGGVGFDVGVGEGGGVGAGSSLPLEEEDGDVGADSSLPVEEEGAGVGAALEEELIHSFNKIL